MVIRCSECNNIINDNKHFQKKGICRECSKIIKCKKQSERKKAYYQTEKGIEERKQISKNMQGNKNAEGTIFTEERKQKISKANTGKKHTEETKQKLRIPCSEEKKKKLSEANKGKKLSEETKEKMRGRIPWNKGKKMSSDFSKKCSLVKSGKEPWNKGLTKENDSRVLQYSIKNKGKRKNKETIEKIKKSKEGYIPSQEAIKNMRLAAIDRIERTILNNGQLKPNYNPNGCEILNEHSKVSGSFIQHAENGGEYHIKELGYWVDGYDKENNIVYEIDENHHFDIDGNLREKDMYRQQEIEDYLKCKFIRIKLQL